MLFQRRPLRSPSLPGHRYSMFVHREFQKRYVGFLLGAVLAAMLVAGGPSYYFLNQNYEIFTSIAYNTAPQLLPHLERERLWITCFLAFAAVGASIFCVVFGLRLTNRIVKPLTKLEIHLKLLTRGHWYVPEIQLEEHSEFLDLIETYNYFYKSLRATSLAELENLLKITVDRNDRQSQLMVQNLVHMKSQQMGQPSAWNVAVEKPSLDSRHAS